MALPLAPDDIVIQHGDLAVRLMPSLRAAIRLQRKHGLTRLVRGIAEGNLTIMLDIVAEGGDPITARTIIDRKIQAHFGNALADLQAPLNEFLAICYAIDSDPKADHRAETREKSGKPFDLAETLAEFFEIATGWLGWTPAQALDAIPAEIMAAHSGLSAKLKAIHGAADEDKPDTFDPLEEVTPEQAKQGIATLRAMTRKAS